MLVPRLGQPVEPQIVFLVFNLLQKISAQVFKLHLVHLAFKHGLLHPLAVILAYLGNTAKPSPARFGVGADIIGNDNPHNPPSPWPSP